jgi:double-stranded uracil-DNA glycosylase
MPKLARVPKLVKARGNSEDPANYRNFRSSRSNDTAWSSLRLRDRIAPNLRVLFVGINPGVRSATTGHHFAGYSNRFWKLLYEAKVVPEPITYEDDARLLEWGMGVTNLVARPSPGIDDLKPAEYVAGWKILEKKIVKYRPTLIALVGVTLYRAVLPLLEPIAPEARRERRLAAKSPESVLGLRPETIHGARLFVLPNPSGRNANFSHAEMLEAFGELKQKLPKLPKLPKVPKVPKPKP